MKHKVIRLLSIVCALSILIVAVPVTARAQTVDTATDIDKTISDVLPEEEEQTPVTILKEEVEMREQNVKYFRCDDGTILAAVYDNPVHYKNGNQWEDIDNSLITANSKNGMTYYTNKANDLKVRIPENLNGTAPVEVENQGYTLQWVAVDGESDAIQLPITRPPSAVLSMESTVNAALTASQQIIEAETENDNQTQPRFTNEYKTYIEKQNTDVTYANVYNNTDIRYDIVSNKLKESIVFEALPTKTAFAFRMQAVGLTAVLQQNNAVCFYAEEAEEPVFVIVAPYMFDNNGEYSDDVTVTLTQQRDGWLYTLTPSREWLADANRAYPVTLDPTVETGANDSSMMATEIYSGKVDRNYSDRPVMYVGGYVENNTLFESQSLLQFDLPAATSEYSNMQIVSAQLKLTNRTTGDSEAKALINMYQITSAWSEDTVTWRRCPAINSSVKDCRVGTSGSGECVFDITALANAWAKDGTTNHGVAFAAVNAAIEENAVQWHTEDSTTAISRPTATISYRECVGIEDYWTYTSMSVGRGASAAVNNATGALTIVIPDCGIDGNRMPVSISHVHNTSFTKVATYGGKFRLNYQMSITATGITDYPYYFIDGDGTKHYFKLNEGEMKDEDGLGLTLTVSNSSADEKFVITAKDQSKMAFNDDGNLRFIRDANDNQIEVVYSSDDVIDKIIDGAGRIYQFAYDTAGRLESITDPAGRQITYAYNSWDELNTIRYPDGNVVNTFYNNAKVRRLNGNGQAIIFEYDNASPVRVMSMSYYESTETSYIDRYTFNYKVNATDITDYYYKEYESGIVNIANNTFTYQYNTFLQTVCVVNQTDDSAQSYKMGKPGGSDGTENKLTSVSNTQKSVVNHIVNGSLSRNFITDNTFQRVGSTISYDANKGHSGLGSIYINHSGEHTVEEPTTYAKQEYTIPKNGYYTVSAYANVSGNNGEFDATLSLQRLRANRTEIGPSYLVAQAKTDTDDWVRLHNSVYCYAGEILEIRLGARGTCDVWFDDIQLEQDTLVANTYNLLENTDFQQNIGNWVVRGDNWGSVIDNTSPAEANLSMQVTAFMTHSYIFQGAQIQDGKAGDVYSFGCWAKANSMYVSPDDHELGKQAFGISIEFYTDDDQDVGNRTRLSFNPYYDDWQFVSGEAIAPADYDIVYIVLEYNYNIDSANFALPFLYKDTQGQSYTYDKNGNVVSTVDSSQAQSSYAYNDDQLSKLASPTGSEQLMTYDETTQNLEYVQTSDGQRYEYTYDSHGNATGAKVYASPYATELTVNTPYYIRNAYSGNAFTADAVAHDTLIHNQRWAPADDKQLYCLVSTNETDVYAIRPYLASASGLRLDVEGNVDGEDGRNFQLYNNNDSANQRFKFEQNDNGTFTILTKVSEYAKCIDGQPGDATDTDDNTPIKHQPVAEGDAGQQWYFIPYNANDSQTPHYESSATYTADGNYLATSTDSLGQTTSYETDTRGNTTSVTDAGGVKTTYGYDTYGIHNTSVSVSKNNTNVGTVNYTYSNDRLTSIVTSGLMRYDMTYDNYGRADAVYIGDANNERMLSKRTYNDKGLLSRLDYGNGDFANYAYDALGRQTKMWYGDNDYERLMSFYTAQGQLGLIADMASNTRTRYAYDVAGRLERVYKSGAAGVDSALPIADLRYMYENGTNRLTGMFVGTKWHAILANFVYGNARLGQMPDTVYQVKRGDTTDITYTYDNLGRLTERYLPGILKAVNYVYADSPDGGNATSTQVAYVTTPDGTTSYTYDAAGNITSETFHDKTIQYTYDALNQLTSVTDGDTTYRYTYDANGNILFAEEGSITNYALYGDQTWKDLLISYNGQSITYDAIGNPLTYRDGINFTWENGRQLASYTQGNDSVIFDYYSDGGRRMKKKAGEESTFYVYVDGVLYAQEHDGDVLAFAYDEKGKPYMVVRLSLSDIWEVYDGRNMSALLSVTEAGQRYYYEYNLQGDVVGLFDASGNRVAAYTYDPWGKLLTVTDGSGNAVTDASHIANLNPLRYRGYYYDTETGFYYVSSRYYDPEIGRWISPEPNVDYGEFDEGAGLLGYNVYAYCANNPVMFKDETGESITLACVLIGAGIGLIVGAVGGSHYAKYKKNLTPSDGWDYWKYVVGFGVAGGAVGALVGWGAGALIAKYGVATAATSITKGGGARFSSFNALKRSLGSAGKGKQWHHIVEQCQIGKSGFSKYWIQNSNNVINISNSVHSKISAHYSSKIPGLTGGKTVRDWLAGQSFQKQYEYGIKILRQFGVKI